MSNTSTTTPTSKKSTTPSSALTVYVKGTPVSGTLCGPDSLYIPEFMQKHLKLSPAKVFAELMKAAPCAPRNAPAMKYRGHELNRTKFFLVESNELPVDTTKPPSKIRKYTYPGWQWESMLFYRPFEAVPLIKHISTFFNRHVTFEVKQKSDQPDKSEKGDDEVAEDSEVESEQNPEFEKGNAAEPPKGKRVVINHVIGTKYLNGDDNIGFHTDKMKDIRENSLIFILSLGESRELHIRDIATGVVEHKVAMESGSLFILGPITNQLKQHAIVKEDEEAVIKRKGPIKPRLSLVLRDIKTVVTIEDVHKHVKQNQRKKERDAEKKATKDGKTEKPNLSSKKSDLTSEESDKTKKKPKDSPPNPKKRKATDTGTSPAKKQKL